MKLIKKVAILSLAAAAIAQEGGDERRKNRPKQKQNFQPKPLAERIKTNVDVAKRQLAKLVNPDDTKEDALMMKMFEAKIDANGGLSDSLLDTLLTAVSEDGDDGVNIDRNLGCSGVGCKINLSLKGIWEYGCWCSFGPSLLNGGGSPVSPHDQFCMSMTKCLRCAEKDTPGCNAINTTYDVANSFNPNGNEEELKSACAAINGNDPCKTHVCMCETNLLANIVDAVWTGVVYDSSFLHSQNFDSTQCHNGGRGNPEGQTGDSDGGEEGNGEDCCGFYPTRAPFNLGNGRVCCDSDQTLFSNLDSICCDDGVHNIGNPCQ